MHYISYWEGEFARARKVVKSRASNVVVVVSGSTAAIAVVGAATSILNVAWLGIISAALAGLAGVVSAWDGLFRHRELWHQRSLVLGELQALKRWVQIQEAICAPSAQLAVESMARLDEILANDLQSWSELRTQRSKGASSSQAG